MSRTLLNPKVVTQDTSTVSVTIEAGSTYYLRLPDLNSKPGYTMVGAIVNTSSMSNITKLIPSQIQTNGAVAWMRVHNMGSAASTGTMFASVRWARG